MRRLCALKQVTLLFAESDGELVALATYQQVELVYRSRPQCRITALVVR